MQVSVKDTRSALVAERTRLMGELTRHDAAIAALDAFGSGAVPASNGKKPAPALVTGKKRGRPPLTPEQRAAKLKAKTPEPTVMVSASEEI